MLGIEFVSSLNHNPFVNSANAILNSVKAMAAQVRKSGGDISDMFKRIADGGQTEMFERKAQIIAATFKNIISNIELTADEADAAKERISKAMDEFANSTEKPKVKFQELLKDLSKVYDEIKSTKAPVGEAVSTSELDSLKKRLEYEESIIDVMKEQRDMAEANRKKNAEGLKRNMDLYADIVKELQKKYNGQSEGFYSEADKARLQEGRESIENWKKAWEDSNTQVQAYGALIEEANSRTANMRQTIEGMSNVYKGYADTVESSSNKLFISEDVFNRYHQLSKTIDDLKAQIDSMPDKDINIPQLQGLQKELSEAQEEFRALDEVARHAAEVLGNDLGGKVSSALAKLYDMNKAVRLNETRYNELQESVRRAKEELAEAKDPAAITRARAEVDKLQKELDVASDNLSKFKAQQADAVSAIQKLSKQVEESSNEGGQDVVNAVTEQAKGLIGKVAAIAGIGFGLNELKDFFSQAKEWRSYFEDIESSMKVFLGSAEKGSEFTQKLKDYAYYNMFEFSDLAAASQQMISYGHNVESIIPRLDQLSNVATGTHGSLMELVDAYNRAKATGVVDARGLQSWAVKGVMIRDVLRDMGEVATGTTITFDQLNKVLDHVTGEGGQFHNLMGEMMDNISAEEGQLEDNLAAMYSAIGEKYEGVFVKILKLQSAMADSYQTFDGGLIDWGADAANAVMDELLEHWKEIVEVVKDAVVVYGSYRAALIVTTAVQKAKAKWDQAALTAQRLNNMEATKESLAKAASTASEVTNTAAKKSNAAASGKQAAATGLNRAATDADTLAKGRNTAATVLLTKAWKGLTTAMLSNPYALVAAAIAGLVYTIYAFNDSVLTQEESQKILNDTSEAYKKSLEDQDAEIRKNIGIIQNKNASLVAQAQAYRELIKLRGIFAKYTPQEIAAMSPERLDTLLNQSSEESFNQWEERRLQALEKLQEKYKDAGIAFFHPKQRIKDIAEEFELGDNFAKELTDKIGRTTDLSDFFDRQVSDARESMTQKLAQGAEDALVAGLKNGFSDKEVGNAAAGFLNRYTEEIKPLQQQQEDNSANLEPLQEQLKQLENERNAINQKSLEGELGGAELKRLQEINALLPEVRKKIEDINGEQERVSSSINDVSAKYKDGLLKLTEQAYERVEKLGNELDKATGEKKAEINIKYKQAVDDYNTLQGALKLVEAGTSDAEVVVSIIRKMENAELGNEKLVEIRDKYNEIDDIGQTVASKIDEARKKFEEMPDMSYYAASKMMEDMGLTAESIDSDFAKTRDALEKDIDDLKGKLSKFDEDTEDYRKISLEIQRKEEQLNYLDTLRDGLKDICKNPFNLKLALSAIIPKPVKEILNKFFGLNIDEEGKLQKDVTVSGVAREEGDKAEEELKANRDNKNGHSGKYYRDQIKQEEKNKIAEYRKYISGKGKGVIGGVEYDYSNLTAEENDKLQQYFKGAEQQMKQGNKTAKEALQRRQKDYDQFLKDREQSEAQAQKTSDTVEAARIAAIKDNGQREREEQANQHRLALQAIDDQEEEMKKRNVEQQKAQWQNRKENKDKIWADTATARDIKANGYQNIKLTEDQQKELSALRATEAAKYQRILEDNDKKERKYLYDYIKEYGSIQDQRAAITKEYDEKIEEESNAIQKAALEKQKKAAIAALDMKEWQNSIDWELLFNDMDRASTEALRSLRDKLREALRKGDMTPENAQVVSEKLLETENEITTRTNVFANMIPALQDRVRLTNAAKVAEDGVADAQAKQAKAINDVLSKKASIKELLEGTGARDENGNKLTIDESAISVDMKDAIFKMFDVDENSERGKKLSEAFDNLATSTTDLTKSQENLTRAQQQAKDANAMLDSLGGKGDFGKAFSDIMNHAADAAGGGVMGWATLINDNIQSMPELIDTIGLHDTEFGEAVSEFADGTNNFMAAIQSFASGDIIGGVTNVIKGFQSWGHMLGIGGGNEKEVAETMSRLDERNATLDDSIKRLTSVMDKSAGTKAIEAYNQAVTLQQEKEANLQEKLNAQMGYHSAHHSFNHYWEGFTEQELAMVNSLLDQEEQWNGDLSAITAEQAAALMANADLVQKISETGKGGYGDRVVEQLEAIAAEAGVANQMTENLRNNLTQTSFDSLRDSYLDTLTDMESSTADFAKSFEQMMFKAMINSLVLDEEFDKWLKDWQARYAKAVQDNDTDALAGLQKEATEMRDRKVAEREQYAEAMNYDTSSYTQQSASSKAWQSMGQETGEELNGRFTALQIAGESINTTTMLILDTLTGMSAATQVNSATFSELRNLAITRNAYLEDIAKYSKGMYNEFKPIMNEIAEYTSSLGKK